MNHRTGPLSFSFLVALVVLVLGGCVGYAGPVGPSNSGASKTTPGGVSVTPATVSFGSVLIGGNSSRSVSVLNGGGAAVVLSSLSSSNAAFVASGLTLPMNLPSGQSVSFQVAFSPTAAGASNGTLALANNGSSSPTMISVTGTGAADPTPGSLSASPASVNIGNVNVGSTGSQTFSVTNSGGTAVTLSSVSSSAGAFTATGPTLPMSLGAGQSASFQASFAPTAAGAASGTITFASNASNAPTAISVSGTGVALATAPTISSQPAGKTVIAGQTATFAVTAAGTAPLAYQWQKNGAAISGASAASYTTPATTSGDNGASFAVVVSNSAGSVTSSGATLTVSAATLSLSANPASLNFGSVNVGSNSAQTVTFTNGGNANVTVSSVTVSGAGFNATGISNGQVVTPGQTASLNVTFAPGASGTASGSVVVASNAANSPLTVALSGTGAPVTPPPTAGAPTCGKNNDTNIEVPSDWSTFVPPAKGQSYVDSSFGCTVTRITDVSSEIWGGSFYLPINMGYSTVSPFNANDTFLMLGDGWGRHFVTDLQGNIVVPIANMPDCGNSSSCTLNNSSNDTWFYWDATNPNIFYYTTANSMMKGTIAGSAVTTSVVHQFTEYSVIDFMDKTDLSEDGQHVVIVGGDASGSNPENVFDYNFVTNVKGPVYTTGCSGSAAANNNSCIHGVTQTPDNNVAIDFANDGTGLEQGVRLWSGIFPLIHLQDGTNHMDTGYDMNGNAVYIELGNSQTILGLTNPCPSGWGTDVRQIYDVLSAVCLVDIDLHGSLSNEHVGYRGSASQPWVSLSFFDNRTPSPEWFDNSGNYAAPSPSNWQYLEDEIDLVRIDANNNPQYVYRLAHGYSRSNEDFYAQPHASLSRDGRYAAFQSNAAYVHTGCPANFQSSTGCSDVYVVKVK